MSELNNNLTEPEVAKLKPNKLTRLVKHFLDALWYFTIGMLGIWFIAVLVIGFNIPSEPELRHTDVNFYLNFKVYPEHLTPVTDEGKPVSELIQGSGQVKVNNTKSLLAWYLSNGITEIMGLLALYALFYLRKIFTHLIAGNAFNKDIPDYIQKVGYVFIGWNIIYPLMVYFGGLVILNDIGQHADSIQLSPMIEFKLVGIFTGLAILVLAGVMKEAASIYQEQSLTI